MMKTITAITAQKRNPNRVNLYLDGEFALGLDAHVAAQLKVGQTITTAELDQLADEETYARAKQSVLGLISRRPRSVREIEQYLRRKAYSEAVQERVCHDLQAVGLLDDEAFARYWVEQRETFKPRSHRALRQELMQKGISRQIITTVLATVDELAAARRAAQKRVHRWGHLPEDDFRAKLGGYLQRRGFHYDIIRQITEELWKAASQETPNQTTTLD